MKGLTEAPKSSVRIGDTVATRSPTGGAGFDPKALAEQFKPPSVKPPTHEEMLQIPKIPEQITSAYMDIGGNRYTGATHFNAIEQYMKKTGKPIESVGEDFKSGFLTNTGRAIQKEEALKNSQ